jgi:hypothetical protein
VLGRTRREALAALARAGFPSDRLRITRTAPPWSGQPIGEERVIRQRWDGHTLELLMAAEGFRREGR